jgi:hypothetical protein
MTRTNRGLLAVLAIAGVTACGGGGGDGGGGSTGPSPASTTYTGFMTADDGSSAGLSLTFASAVSSRGTANLSAPVAVTGTATLVGGGTISLSGSVDAGVFTATGGGLTLNGTLGQSVLNGRFSGSGVNGGFAAAAASAGHEVYAFCGRYTGTVVNSTDTESGGWHALVTGSEVVGDVIPDGTSADAFLTGFLGTASAGPGGTTKVTVNITVGSDSFTADGSVSAAKDQLTGNYSKNSVDFPALSSAGTFAGDRCPGT